MSRQQKRAFYRTAAKKIGQMKAAESELMQNPKHSTARYNAKKILRLQSELQSLGVVPKPGFFSNLIGRIKATFRFMKRRLA